MFGADQGYEDLLRDGITAAKNDQRRLAQSLLRQAIMLNSADSRPYLWLSATTDDPAEKREYLEMALAIDPNNTAARRGLALLSGKIDTSRLAGDTPAPAPVETPAGEAPPETTRTFQCRNCGGHITFSPGENELVCGYCGLRQHSPEDLAEPVPVSDGVVDFVLPTTLGQGWAQSSHHVMCSRCGAHSLLSAGQATTTCAYCGANAFVDVVTGSDLLDPQGVLPIRVDADKAAQAVRKWLGRGFFAPDDLLVQVRQFNLRPAYYAFWMFDGTMFLHWTCEVRDRNDRTDRWEPRTGVETRFLRGALVPGVKALKAGEVENIEPFDLSELQPFNPEYLAGWPALIYDRSMADSSLLARERLVKQVRRELYHLVEPMREKRNLQSRNVEWSGMTFKHLLLPIWVGTYHYAGKEYHLLVNGQTGKVGGYKPRDTIKVVLLLLIIGVSLALLAWLLIWLLSSGVG